MTHILQLPIHLLEIVFEHIIVGRDLKNCRLVCSKWHAFIGKRMFEEICLGSTWLEDFIQLNERSGQSKVTPVGRFVETMYLFRTGNVTFDGFRRVVNCFPNLKRLMLCLTTFKDNNVSKYLLEIDDSIK